MARGITPFIGLAVVVALALAAVFGSMSLANPAMAQSVDMTVEIVEGETEWVVFTDEIENYPRSVSRAALAAEAVVVTPASDREDATTSDDNATADPDEGIIVRLPVRADGVTLAANLADHVDLGIRDAAIRIEALDGEAGKTGRVSITLADDTATPNDPTYTGPHTVTIAVNVIEPDDSTPATRIRRIADMQIEQSATGEEGNPSGVIDLTDYFVDGTGPKGEIENYTIAWTSTQMDVTDDTTAPYTGWVIGAATQTMVTSSDGTVVFRASNVNAGTSSVYVTVTANDSLGGSGNENPEDDFFVEIVAEPSSTGDLPRFAADSNTPGKNTRYEVEFMTKAGESGVVNTLSHDLVIEFHEDYTVPSSISTSSVTVMVKDLGANNTASDPDGTPDSGDDVDSEYTFNPASVDVDGEKVIMSLGDMNNRDDERDYEISGGATILVVFRQSAGISNASEAGDYFLVEIAFGNAVMDGEFDEDEEEPANLMASIPRKISLDEEDGGLGDIITVTGKGFENGVTMTFFLDKPDSRGRRNGDINLGEEVLCVVPQVSSSNVGSCSFTVTHPTFSVGDNFIAAFDGDGNTADTYGPDFMHDDQKFVLKASISATPSGGSPGELMQIQVVDFPTGSISKVELAREPVCGGEHSNPAIGMTDPCTGSVDSTGAGAFSIVIPNWARAGRQELRVTAGTKNATTNVDIVGPQISATPGTVLANQRVSLVGVGFSAGEEIARVATGLTQVSSMTIGGEMIPWSRINGAEPVSIDNGGNWSASVDLPLAEATTASGERTIRVTDSGGRSGVVIVTIPERTVTITPESGRVGTIAVVRGTGFPSKNDEGSSFNVEIVYQAENGKSTTVSALPDASGRFEVQLRIPTTAAIPSSNSVLVSFDDDDKVTVPVSVAHEVPEGIIQTSESSGGPGSTVTVSGEGFKAFVPISRVLIGSLEVTPSPKPQTDGNGMMSFNIIVPGLDVGIQTIEVNVGGTVSSVGFTVTESGVNPGDIKPVAEAVEPLGDNLEVVWHFNNDTKSWTFYDGQEGSDLTHMITGETYLLQVKATVEAILNRDTRSLTCVNGNCWNQIVW